MKLELKHLAGYLPYGLKIETPYGIEILEALGEDWIFTEEKKAYNFTAKPILRPLSDLTKEIEINGEKFVPYDKLNYKPTIKHVSDYPFNCFDLQFIAHYSFQLLIEWHFDVFGLIEKDLAININTLKK